MKYFNNFDELYNNNTDNTKHVFNFESSPNATYWAGIESFEKSCVDNLVDFFGDLVEYYDETNDGVYNGDYEDIFDEWRILGEADVVCDYVINWETFLLTSCKDIINDLGDGESADDFKDTNEIFHRADFLLNQYWDYNRDDIFAEADNVIMKKYPKQYWADLDERQ